MTVTKQEVQDYSLRTSQQYIELINDIDNFLLESVSSIQINQTVIFPLKQRDLKYVKQLIKDYELAGWKVSYRVGLNCVEFS